MSLFGFESMLKSSMERMMMNISSDESLIDNMICGKMIEEIFPTPRRVSHSPSSSNRERCRLVARDTALSWVTAMSNKYSYARDLFQGKDLNGFQTKLLKEFFEKCGLYEIAAFYQRLIDSETAGVILFKPCRKFNTGPETDPAIIDAKINENAGISILTILWILLTQPINEIRKRETTIANLIRQDLAKSIVAHRLRYYEQYDINPSSYEF